MTQLVQEGAADRVGALAAEALQLYRAQKWDEAEQRCAAVLQVDDSNVRILALSGTLHAMRGSCEEAVRLIGVSLNLEPRQPFALNTMGNALRALKRHQDAVTAYEKAIALNPGLAAAHKNMGFALAGLGRQEDAIASFDKAIALEPENAEAYFGRGEALRKLRRREDALASHDKAIELKPDYAEAYAGRGLTLVALARFTEAGESYDKSFAIKPDADAYRDAGDLCSRLWRYEAAVALFENCIKLRPDDATAHLKRATALRTLRRFDEALESIERAIELDPATQWAAGERLTIKMMMCHWKGLSENIDDLWKSVENGLQVSLPFPMLNTPSGPSIHRKCAELFTKVHRTSVAPLRSVSAAEPERLRVAYISADFRTHPVARHIVGLIEAHDSRRFETIGVCLASEAVKDVRARLMGAFDRFVQADNMNDDDAVAMLRDLDVHIAVDLTSLTRGGRMGILARRVAPIQVNYLGYAGTMGAEFMDYIIADQTVIPAHEQSDYAEKTVYMPYTYMPNGRSQVIAEASREAAELPETGFVFCSFNNSYKIMPEVFDVWMRLLASVENSVLWLSQANAAAIRNLDAEAAARGIDPRRLIFATPMPKSEDHLGRLRLADLFLDTLPYNAHSTACEALWAGLPVLTCMGQSFPGRVAASVLNAVGLPEMVTHSLADYEARALELARNPLELAAVREKLARNRKTHPLFDTVRYTRHLEAAYLRMWENHRRGKPAVSFAVDDA